MTPGAATARRRTTRRLLAGAGLLGCLLLAGPGGLAGPAGAAAAPATAPSTAPTAVPSTAPTAASTAAPARGTGPTGPSGPAGPATGTAGDGTVSVTVGGTSVNGGKPSSSVVILIGLTVLSVAPALLLLCTSFTKIFVVLSITRNAMGLTSVPPNQVLAGLALFLSLFVMGPVLSKVNTEGVQPYLHGTKSQQVAFTDGVAPLRTFMAAHTRPEELALLTKVAAQPLPKNPQTVPLATLVPAFVLSELRAALIIGFAIYVPFLVIDMVVSASLMSMGMMMLPPVTVSLPFKMLLFVLANGWGLVVTSLVASYH